MPQDLTNLDHVLDPLIQVCITSEQRYLAAAQHARNRGLKLVLKTYAEQRIRFARQLRDIVRQAEGGAATNADPDHPAASNTGEAMNRGWNNIRAWFTVRRQSRQRLLLRAAVRGEEDAIRAYQAALGADLPPAVATVLQKQLAEVQAAQARLLALATPPEGQMLLVRLFDEPTKAEQAIATLQGSGVAGDDIYLAPIEDVAVFDDEQVDSNRARWLTVTVGVLVGALIGMLIALPAAIAQRQYLPQLHGLFSTTPNGVFLEWLIGGAALGTMFGFAFTILMGQDIVEDDEYLYAESLQNGNTLIAVTASPNNRPTVEKALGLKHQFEVQPSAV